MTKKMIPVLCFLLSMMPGCQDTDHSSSADKSKPAVSIDHSDSTVKNSSWPLPPLISGDWETVSNEEAKQVLADLRPQLKGKDHAVSERVTQIRKLRLPFYPDGYLYEGNTTLETGERGLLTFVKSGKHIIALDGSGSTFHKFNRKAPLSLSSPDSAKAYLKFFCSALTAEFGRFAIVERLDEMRLSRNTLDSVRHELVSKIKPVEIQRNPKTTGAGKNAYEAKAFLSYGNTLFYDAFEIESDGSVVMKNDEPVVQNIPIEMERFAGPLRLGIKAKNNETISEGDAGTHYNLGLDAYNKKDYKEALKQFRLAANQGHAKAQNNLGVMYDNGQGVPQDYKEAAKWFRLAADQGYARAQRNLGIMYESGRGMPEDYGEAGKWYRKAADQGDAEAQFYLGQFYDEGQGVPKNDSEAVKWYRKAADQGYAPAQLKNKHITPQTNNVPTVPSDNIKSQALKFLDEKIISIKKEKAENEKEQGKIKQDLTIINKKITKYNQELTQNNQEIAKGKKNIAELRFKLGVNALELKNYKEAVKQFQLAADQGHAKAQFNLGVMYAKGEGVPRDDREAVKWYRKAADQGDADAKKALTMFNE